MKRRILSLALLLYPVVALATERPSDDTGFAELAILCLVADRWFRGLPGTAGKQEVSLREEMANETPEQQLLTEENYERMLSVDLLEMEVGYGLIPLAAAQTVRSRHGLYRAACSYQG